MDIGNTGKGLRLPSILLEEGHLYSPRQVEFQFAQSFPMLARDLHPQESLHQSCPAAALRNRKHPKTLLSSLSLFSSLCLQQPHSSPATQTISPFSSFGSWCCIHPGAWWTSPLPTTPGLEEAALKAKDEYRLWSDCLIAGRN